MPALGFVVPVLPGKEQADLDWMEEMTGLELQARLSALSPGTRVIIITGRDDPAAKLAALESGVTGFFTKPFDDDQFISAVRSALAMQIH